MSDRDAGFTLVEVMVATALISLLTALAYGTVKLGVLSWSRIIDHRNEAVEQESVLKLLKLSITQAYPAFSSEQLTDPRIAFEGGPTALSLITRLPLAFNQGVLGVERFYIANEGATQSLFMSWALDLPDAKGNPLPLTITRIESKVSGLRFQYFGSYDETSPAGWHDEWRDRDVLPNNVRVQIWRNTTPNRAWIDFVASPRITTPTACSYDLVDPTCRRLK